SCGSFFPRQSKSHICIAALGSHLASPAGDDHKLATIGKVSRRRRVTTGRQLGLPYELAIASIESSDHFIFSRGDEDQPAGCNDRPTIILKPCGRDALCSK